MGQTARDYALSALAGFTKAVAAVSFLAILDFGAVAVTGGAGAAISATAAAAAIMPTFAVVIGCIVLLGGPLSPDRGNYERKGFTELVAGAATAVAGINLLLGLFFKPPSSSSPDRTRTKAQVEDTRGVSFLSHKNTFNASAKNSEKTLVLTAKDFSSAPAATQPLPKA